MRKPRSITRSNKKKCLMNDPPVTIRNDAGYNDPTPYFAFRNMERDKRKDAVRYGNAQRSSAIHAS